MDDVLQLLTDETRYKIFQETLKHGEMTTSKYLDLISISRSTLSHHLSKLVSADILHVRIAPIGRTQKFWTVNLSGFPLRRRVPFRSAHRAYPTQNGSWLADRAAVRTARKAPDHASV